MSSTKPYQTGKLMTPPSELRRNFIPSSSASAILRSHIEDIRRIIRREDTRKLLVIGPCSLHDRASALEFAERLKKLSDATNDTFVILMRTYFEKPRTTVGWKGWISDANFDGAGDLNHGYHTARALLCDIAELGLPTATEVIHPATIAYVGDLLSWSCIGARTAESQLHRELASGLSIPVAFKNSTSGAVDTAINAMQAAAKPHSYVGCDDDARLCHIHTEGNTFTHLILRGGATGPNYQHEAVSIAIEQMRSRGIMPNVMIDCCHGNSQKQPSRVPAVFADVIAQIAVGNDNIIGIMLESHLLEGRQNIPDDVSTLIYGQSITDPCLSWEATERLVLNAYTELTS